MVSFLRKSSYVSFILSCLISGANEITISGELPHQYEVTSRLQNCKTLGEIDQCLREVDLSGKTVNVAPHVSGTYYIITIQDKELVQYTSDIDFQVRQISPDHQDLLEIELHARRKDQRLIHSYLKELDLFHKGRTHAHLDRVQDIKEAIKQFYIERSYLSVDVDAELIYHDRVNSSQIYAYFITPGRRFKINEVSVMREGEGGILLESDINGIGGKKASLSNVLLLKKELSNELYTRGHLNHFVKYKFVPVSDSRANLEFIVSNLETYQVGELELELPVWLDRAKFKKMCGISTKRSGYLPGYLRTKRELLKRGLIKDMSLKVEFDEANREADMEIKVEDKPTNGIKMGMYYSTIRELYGLLDYRTSLAPVLFNGDKSFASFKATAGEYFHDISFQYETFYFQPGGFIKTLSLASGYQFQAYDSLDYDSAKSYLSAEYSLSSSDSIEHTFAVEAGYLDLGFDQVYGAAQDSLVDSYFRLETRYALAHQLDKPLYNGAQFKIASLIEFAQIWSDSSELNYKVNFENKLLLQVNESVRVQLESQVTTLYSVDGLYPYDRLFLGGDRMKGFDYLSIGAPIGGEAVTYNEILLEHRVWGQLFVGVFYEAGTVFGQSDFSDSSGFYSDYGIQFSADLANGSMLSAYFAVPHERDESRFSSNDGQFGIVYNVNF